MDTICLIIDDEPHIRRAVRNAVADAVDRVVEAASAVQGVDLAAAHRPALIVLDLGLPDRPGSMVCREVRKWSTSPIIVLSAQHSEHEKVALLDAGADDYMTKPFSPAELRARVRAQLRRVKMSEQSDGDGVVRIDGLEIDLAARIVRRDGAQVHLTPTEWEILRSFVRHAGKTLTHAQLFRSVWARSSGDPQQYLRVYVAQLRRKLEPGAVPPKLILTEPGVGYRFAAL